MRRWSEGGCGEWLSLMSLHPAPTPQGTWGGEDLGDIGEGGGEGGEEGGEEDGEEDGEHCTALFVIQYCTHYE